MIFVVIFLNLDVDKEENWCPHRPTVCSVGHLVHPQVTKSTMSTTKFHLKIIFDVVFLDDPWQNLVGFGKTHGYYLL